jgi:hypothetical protein
MSDRNLSLKITMYPVEERPEILELRRQKKLEKMRQYRLANPQYKETKKKYREEHADEITTYAKEYYNKNKDKRNADAKQYYLENKEAMLKQKSEQHTCACGCVIRRSDTARHLKTAKHAKHLAFKATENVEATPPL